MSELPTTAKPVGSVVKTARRLAVALTMSIGVGLLMMPTWRSSLSSLFFRTIILAVLTALERERLDPEILEEAAARAAARVASSTDDLHARRHVPKSTHPTVSHRAADHW